METLPIELYRSIALNLEQDDFSSFVQVNSKCYQIPNEHFWYQKVQYRYPNRVATRPIDQGWDFYYYSLSHPIVRYTDIYKIGDQDKIKYQKCIRISPNYTWKPVESLSSEQLSQERAEIQQRKQKEKRESRERWNRDYPQLKATITRMLADPVSKSQLILQLQTCKASYGAQMQQRIDLFCENSDPDLLLLNNESQEDDLPDSIENLEKIYVITTQSYELIALVKNDQRFTINSDLYPDSYHLFAITADFYISEILDQAICKLAMTDEKGIKYLLETIRYFGRNIIENLRISLTAPEIRLKQHLMEIYPEK